MREVEVVIDGRPTRVLEGDTILQACKSIGIETPTLCYLETLTPVNVCRVCVVEVEGSRVLVPACSRQVEPGMVVQTDSERVRVSRRLVFELLGSSVDLVARPTAGVQAADMARYRRDSPQRIRRRRIDSDRRAAGRRSTTTSTSAITRSACSATSASKRAAPMRRTRSRLRSRAAGSARGIATEFDTPLPDSACVYCGNCIGVCPTGALMFKSEHDMRQAGTWDESKQTVTDTICPYCGVGCTLQLHVQDNSIVRVTSPLDHDVTSGHLCIKGRFGWQFVQNRPPV